MVHSSKTINRDFLIKASGINSEGKRINILVGVRATKKVKPSGQCSGASAKRTKKAPTNGIEYRLRSYLLGLSPSELYQYINSYYTY